MILNSKDTGTEKYIGLLHEFTDGKKLHYKVITFGCQQNVSDSEKIEAMLEDAGYVPSEISGDEDVVIVNTCAIRAHAEAKALSMLGAYKKYKKNNASFVLGVVGCMGGKKDTVEMLKSDFHYVSFALSPSDLHRIPETLYYCLTSEKRSFGQPTDKFDVIEGIGQKRDGSHKAWVSIMYGCNNYCSYCIVPYVRGRERSRASSDVINECRELVKNGVKEITLLGQNVNSYSADISFSELITEISEIEGDFIIRFMTSHPKDTTDELIEAIANSNGVIAPYFHLPLQSGSDRILSKMNRRYSAEKYLLIAAKLREKIPGIAISTDIIIGFPGESDSDFEDTLSVMKTVKYDMVYAFLYSPREGTPAAEMEDQIPKNIKDERMARLISLAEQLSEESNRQEIGRETRVLVDSVTESDDGVIASGRTANNKLIKFKSSRATVGEFYKVKITDAGAYDLYGEQIN